MDGDLKMEVTDPDPLPPGAWGVMSVTHANSGAPSAAIVTTPGVTGTYFENLSVSTGETTDLIERKWLNWHRDWELMTSIM